MKIIFKRATLIILMNRTTLTSVLSCRIPSRQNESRLTDQEVSFSTDQISERYSQPSVKVKR